VLKQVGCVASSLGRELVPMAIISAYLYSIVGRCMQICTQATYLERAVGGGTACYAPTLAHGMIFCDLIYNMVSYQG